MSAVAVEQFEVSEWTSMPPEVFDDLFDVNPDGFWRLIRFEAENEPDRLDYYAQLEKVERERKAEGRKRLRLLAPPVLAGRLTLAEALERLERVRPRGGGSWSARCPVHDDRTPSLLVSESELRPGEPVFYCYAGCDFRAILEALR